LVKEADALHEAGYDVVAGYRADGPTDRDDAILKGKPWRWHRIDMARGRQPFAWMRAAARQRVAEWIVRGGVRSALVERAAYCRGDGVLTRWASAQNAALYIAHTQPVLAVAAAAAIMRGAPFAFDCEDLLGEDAADGGRAPWRQPMIAHLERRHLPRAAFVSATSVPMAEYLAGRYGLRTTRVWHNCFPAADAAMLRGPADRPAPTGPVELAWISATVGPGRGLEDIFAVLPKLGRRVALHLYGAIASGQSEWLEQQLAPVRERSSVVMHPLQPADAMLAALARHQIGLSLDGDATLNRSLTVSNKFFLYLQAGLACIATDTPGHRSVIAPGAGYGGMYRPGDVRSLALLLETLTQPLALAAAQRAAWIAGRTRYVWEHEKPLFLDTVAGALAGTLPATRRMTPAGSGFARS
jgi:glycosyltransferase involved in cell wall biosynthesis